MESLSKGEFLSFLYAEKSRELENNNAPGWSKWALWGVIISLSIYAYNLIVEHDINTNVVISYFIIALPYMLGFIHIVFQTRIRIHSSLRVRRLIDESPITLYIVRSVLSVIGLGFSIVFYTNLAECALWGFVCAINIAIIIYILANSEKLVSVKAQTAVFNNDIYDLWLLILMTTTYYAIFYIHNQYIKDLPFLRFEFEMTASLVAVLLLLCKLINISQQYSVANDIDRIIEKFTGGFIKQERAYKEYINLLYGQNALFVLESGVDNLLQIKNRCELALDDLKCINIDIEGLRFESCDIIVKKIEAYTKLCEKGKKELLKVSNYELDIIDLPQTDITKEEFTKISYQIQEISSLIITLQKEISTTFTMLKEHIANNLYCNKYKTLCYQKECPQRHDKMSLRDKIKRYINLSNKQGQI